MSRKPVSHAYPVITAGDMGGSLTSAVTAVSYTDNVGYNVIWTGTPTGSITVEATIALDADVTNGTATWNSLTLSPTVSTGGAAGSTLISLNQLPYSHVRLKYTRSSGTGTLNVTVMTKNIGA